MTNLKMETENGEELVTRKTTLDGIVCEPSYVSFLRSQGYAIEEVLETHTVHSNSEDCSYVIHKIQTYAFPKGSALLDVANEDQQIEMYVCSCPGYRFHKTVDVSNGPDVTPDQCGECTHIKQVMPAHRKAMQDDNQDTLL